MANQSSGKDNMDSTLSTLFAKLSFLMFSESDSFDFIHLCISKGESTVGTMINAGKFVLEVNSTEFCHYLILVGGGVFYAYALTVMKHCYCS